jgi:hypothetical protein
MSGAMREYGNFYTTGGAVGEQWDFYIPGSGHKE